MPDTHDASLTKPDVDAFELYLINLSQKELEAQCVRIIQGYPTFEGATNASIRFPNASWSADNVTLGASISNLERIVTHRVDSANATPGVYTYAYSVAACALNQAAADASADRVTLSYSIRTKAVAEETILEVWGTPVLGGSWAGAAAFPKDADGDAVSSSSSQSFDARLTSAGGNLRGNRPLVKSGLEIRQNFAEMFRNTSALRCAQKKCISTFGYRAGGNASFYANCETAWAGFDVSVRCDVPDVNRAGAWLFELELDGVLIEDGARYLDVACRRGTFEHDDFCQRCLDGATCFADGLTVSSLPLRAGRWRFDDASTNVRRCLHADACPGGPFAGDASCAEGYHGPLCAVCDAGYAPAGVYTCSACSSGYRAWAIAVPALVVAALGAAALALWLRRDWVESAILGEMTPRRFSSLKVKAKILFVMEQIAIGVPAQLPAVALPTSYLRYLDAVQWLSLNVRAPRAAALLGRPVSRSVRCPPGSPEPPVSFRVLAGGVAAASPRSFSRPRGVAAGAGAGDSSVRSDAGGDSIRSDAGGGSIRSDAGGVRSRPVRRRRGSIGPPGACSIDARGGVAAGAGLVLSRRSAAGVDRTPAPPARRRARVRRRPRATRSACV